MNEIPTTWPGKDRREGLRARLDEAIVGLARLATFRAPRSLRGRYRAFLAALALCGDPPPAGLVGSAHDGRRFHVDLGNPMQTTVYFLGEYEPAVSDISTALIRPGDVCLDVGANFGWFTSLFGRLVGPEGAVHAFEPVPTTFAELESNYRMWGAPPNVTLNRLALGDGPGTIRVNLFPGEPTGHASISDHGRDDAVGFDCPVVTCDEYLAQTKTGRVDFVKVDIEGAEMLFLSGAGSLFTREDGAPPPIFVMEMALQQSRNFGYRPDDLLDRFRDLGEYDFFLVEEVRRRLIPVERFGESHSGGNVFCLPKSLGAGRRNSVAAFIENS